MKKIMAIGAMAAMVAGAAFATDINGGLKLTGDLFSYDTDGNVVKALQMNNATVDNTSWHLFSMSASGEKAGAWVNVDGDQNGAKTYIDAAGIWIKPVDAFKLSFGNQYFYAHRGQFAWWTGLAKLEKQGFSTTISAGPATIDLALANGGSTAWANSTLADPSKIGSTWADVSVNIDGVGNVMVFGGKDLGSEFGSQEYIAGAGVDLGLVEGLTLKFDAAAYVNSLKVSDVALFPVVDYSNDMFRAAIDFPVKINVVATKDNVDLRTQFYAEVRALDAFTPYVQLVTGNMINTATGCDYRVKAGIKGSVENVSWTTYFNTDLTNADKFSFNIPVELSIGL